MRKDERGSELRRSCSVAEACRGWVSLAPTLSHRRFAPGRGSSASASPVQRCALLCSAFSFLLLISCAPSLDPRSASQALVATEESHAAAAARDGLPRFLAGVPPRDLQAFGFDSPEQRDRAAIGTPFRVYTVDGDALSSVREWRFPVVADGRARALLTVAAIDGRFRAVDFGAAGLAGELSRLEQDRRVPATARRVLVRLYALGADYVAFPDAAARLEDSAFEPLASARAIPDAPRGPTPLSRLHPWIRARSQGAGR